MMAELLDWDETKLQTNARHDIELQHVVNDHRPNVLKKVAVVVNSLRPLNITIAFITLERQRR